jgi:hypothetical protein
MGVLSVTNGDSTATGQGTDITYGGYFSGASGGTNYGVYSAAGTNYFNGNVGIGTTSPTNGVLEVVGQVYFSANCSSLSFTDRP